MKHRAVHLTGTAAAVLLCIAAGCACAPSAGVGNARVELRENDDTCVVVEVLAGDMERSLEDVLRSFEQSGEIAFDGSTSEYGFYLTSLNGRQADADNYWAIYTSLGTLGGVSYSDASYGTWEYDGQALASASYGVSGLPLAEGAIYAFVWTPIEPLA